MNKTIRLCLFLLALLSPAFSRQTVREKDLAPTYQNWLKLTSYIILPQEKEVFLQLQNDRERDIFIESFWRQRDPTPGTPENEYQTEHVKRFEYADKEFHKGAPRDGWMTDMGRFYIILGPPNSKDEYFMSEEIYPCEVWYYFGDTAKRLPTYFALIFFKKGGAGEFKLYDPAADGPISLLVDHRDVDPVDSFSAYEKIKETQPTLAPLTLSLIPGDSSAAFQSTLAASFILKNILESPKKDVNPSYARHFLDYKGVVSTEYLTHIVDCESTIALLRDPLLGVPFLHYSITPKSLSVDYFAPRDQYYCNYSVDVSLRKGEDIFYQDSKEFPFYFAPADSAAVTANGIAVQDSFPVVAGTYKLIILLKNSVGKEFSIVERQIVCEDRREAPGIFGVVLGHKLETVGTPFHMPFRIADKRLYVDPKNTYRTEEEIPFLANLTAIPRDLWSQGELQVDILGLTGDHPARKTLRVKLSGLAYSQDLTVAQAFPASELAPDYYEVKFRLLDGAGNPVDEKPAQFIISPDRRPGRPIAVIKTFPLASSHLYLYILADQYDRTGDGKNAEAFYERGYRAAPEFQDGMVSYARFLVKRGRYQDALAMAERISGASKLLFESRLIRGQALAGLGKHAEAVGHFLEANKIYDSDTRLLNALAASLLKTGQKAEALRALKASLRLNPDQPEIRKLADGLGGD